MIRLLLVVVLATFGASLVGSGVGRDGVHGLLTAIGGMSTVAAWSVLRKDEDA